MLNSSVAIRGLTVDRGGHRVLDGFDVRIGVGSVTGLLGPSGCGKSTLMRCIAGVQRMAGGEVRVFGEPAGSAAARNRLGYMTQASSVYADLTVEQNVRYFADLTGVDRSAVDRALDDVGLSGRRSALTADLSGGQRARVSLAAALVARPELYLLDEPTVGLDPVLRRDLWALFGRLASDGATLLVSSHVMDEADRCDRVLLMRDGQLIADGTPQELRDRTGTNDIESAFLALAEVAS